MPTMSIPSTRSLQNILAVDLATNICVRLGTIDAALAALPGAESSEHVQRARDLIGQAAEQVGLFEAEVRA